MKSVIIGAGSIGGYVGAAMARVGQDVTLFARAANLRALQENGVRVITAKEDFVVRPSVAADLESIGPVDLVYLAVKANSLTGIAPKLAPLMGPETVVVAMQNGLPWWFFDVSGVTCQGLRLESVDPGGVIRAAIEAHRVIGSVVYLAAETEEPGVVRHIEGNRILLGEPDGSQSDRVGAIANAMVAAGLEAPITAHIRNEIWSKLVGNMAFNPISALTGGTVGAIVDCSETRALVRSIMEEGSVIGEKAGVSLLAGIIEKSIEGAAKLGAHKTSMLQDLEKGRAPELEPIVGAALEIGDKLGIPMPATKAVYACSKLLFEVRRS